MTAQEWTNLFLAIACIVNSMHLRVLSRAIYRSKSGGDEHGKASS